MKSALVSILSLPNHVKSEYTYLVGDAFESEIREGSFVTVPFGNGNKTQIGLVTGIGAIESDEKTKSIIGVYEEAFSLSGDLLDLCRYVSDTCLCSFNEAARAIIPPSVLGSPEEYYVSTHITPSVQGELLSLYKAIDECPKGISLTELRSRYGKGVFEMLRSLCDTPSVIRQVRTQGMPKTEKVELYRLTAEPEYAKQRTRSARAHLAIDMLNECGECEKNELKQKTKISSEMLKKLCFEDVIAVRAEQRLRNPYRQISSDNAAESPLSEEQRAAFEEIDALCREEKPHGVLLHGVTGSGKTRVIKALCDSVISRGRAVIMLVPEISLTPQSVSIFCSAYGTRVAVVHSALSAGERADVYRRIADGSIDMVIGTRSAIFAPLKNIGLIVIDEEQEHTYKSEMTPKYHARDIARFRCNAHNAVMLLSSATPSIESYYKAQTGKYRLVRLTHRYGKAQLPKVVIADLREDYASGATDAIGTVLKGELIENKNKGNQSVLFLNRRGYSNFLSCRMCGHVVMCPNCDVSLTYHTTKRLHKHTADQAENEYAERKKNGYLLCHYCGYRTSVPEKCPECSSPHIAYMGHGTQKIAQDIEEYGYGITVQRMDADTTSSKFSYEKILGDFRAQRSDVLLGTQMVTKGHDFPNVTLVGVILADSSLYVSDYHASEQSFSLLTQVIGRAGRAEKKGIAVIQTFNPDNEIIKLASKQDYEGFYKSEIALRRALKFPPFCDMAVFVFTSGTEVAAVKTAVEFNERLKEEINGQFSDVGIQIFGPVEAPVYKLKGNCRMQLIVKCRLNKRTRQLFTGLLRDFAKNAPKNVSVSVSINPTSIG